MNYSILILCYVQCEIMITVKCLNSAIALHNLKIKILLAATLMLLWLFITPNILYLEPCKISDLMM